MISKVNSGVAYDRGRERLDTEGMSTKDKDWDGDETLVCLSHTHTHTHVCVHGFALERVNYPFCSENSHVLCSAFFEPDERRHACCYE